ncbi:RCC1/BLIP-II [Dendrothele bispora CBS 962.96]|uniref:RCC1/BLIP-II n=1 Tax=Dendrothele bispora (strain CBS 962.96) TaxID=1314807 RepID=A0A4S8LWB4_DENBC|nr:RCC1/BLIP-II [Dendrothele bispora CBS 962.96]
MPAATRRRSLRKETVYDRSRLTRKGQQRGNQSLLATASSSSEIMSKKRSASSGSHAEFRTNKRPRRSSLPLNPAVQPLKPFPGHSVTVLVHGSPEFGQLGMGVDQVTEISRPRLHTKIQDLLEGGQLGRHGVEQIVAGGMHSLVVDSDGKVWSWGVNDNMALGRPTQGIKDADAEELESSPAIIGDLHGFRAVRVAACDSYSLALDDTGSIRAWGTFKLPDGRCSFDGVQGCPENVLKPTMLPALANVEICQLACGENHVVALDRTGLVYTWGEGSCRQLGRRFEDTALDSAMSPRRIMLQHIVAVGTGYRHSFAVDKSGVVYGWGLNMSHQIGLSDDLRGRASHIPIPTPIPALHPQNHNGAKVVQFAAGEFHSLFLFDNGEVWGCGQCDQNAVGLAHDRPEYLAAKRAVQSSVGAETVKIDICISEPVRVAFPPPPTQDDPTPPLPPASLPFSSTKISYISADGRYSFACSEQGVLYAWGEGECAQLGLGADQGAAGTPTRVRSKDLKSYRPIGVSCGGQVVLTPVIHL